MILRPNAHDIADYVVQLQVHLIQRLLHVNT